MPNNIDISIWGYIPAICNRAITERTGIPIAQINPKTPIMTAKHIGNANGLTSASIRHTT